MAWGWYFFMVDQFSFFAGFFIPGSAGASFFIILGKTNKNTMNSNLPALLARHFREVHFGGNTTGANLKANLDGVTWQQATTQVGSLNTLLALTYHIHYYVQAVIPVFEGGPLDAHDKYSYDHPAVESEQDWKSLLEKCWKDAERLAKLIEQLPEEKLWETFVLEKYGTWYRNIQGLIEHSYYHTGQVAIIAKMVRAEQP
jgi:hypothetical protein